MTGASALRSIQDVAFRGGGGGASTALPGLDGAAFRRIYRVVGGTASCTLSDKLSDKYKLDKDNVQRVVSVTNLVTLDQAWWNPSRGSKPQTFKGVGGGNKPTAAALDTTGGGARCDFCGFRELTAKDPFGRVLLPHAVTGSNLFKYAEPHHGVVLFRHHDPLEFSAAQVADLLDATWLWFKGCEAASAAADGDGAAAGAAGQAQEEEEQEQHEEMLPPQAPLRPFLLWNSLPRAGASQYHGHAQAMLSRVPVPQQTLLERAASQYGASSSGSSSGSSDDGSDGSDAACFYSDWLRAHRAVGLLRQVSVVVGNADDGVPASVAGGSASASSSSSSSSSTLGSSSADVGAAPQPGTAWAFPSLSPRKDCEVVVVGRHLGCPAFQSLVHASLRALIDSLGVAAFNVGAFNVDLRQPHPYAGALEAAAARVGAAADNGDDGDAEAEAMRAAEAALSSARGAVAPIPVGELTVPPSFPSKHPPVVARIVSRGKIDAVASDFGGLEVFGGASIGHTDPWRVAEALDEALQRLLVV